MVKREREGIFKRRVFLGGEAVFINNASEVCRFKNPILRNNTTQFRSVRRKFGISLVSDFFAKSEENSLLRAIVELETAIRSVR